MLFNEAFLFIYFFLLWYQNSTSKFLTIFDRHVIDPKYNASQFGEKHLHTTNMIQCWIIILWIQYLVAYSIVSVFLSCPLLADWWYCNPSIRNDGVWLFLFLPLSVTFVTEGSFLWGHDIAQFRSFWWITNVHRSDYKRINILTLERE